MFRCLESKRGLIFGMEGQDLGTSRMNRVRDDEFLGLPTESETTSTMSCGGCQAKSPVSGKMINSDDDMNALPTSWPGVQPSKNVVTLNDSGFMEVPVDVPTLKVDHDEKETTTHMAMDSFKIQVEVGSRVDRRNIATTGKEAIHEAIRRDLRLSRNFDKMLVKQEGAYFNLGLPSGVLVEEDGVYECLFPKDMKLTACAEENIRQYNVKSFSKDWLTEFKFFYISFEVPVSQFHGYFRKEKVRVDFFVGEGLYEALYRDGRLSLDKLRSCVIRCKEENAIVSLKQSAEKYHGKHLIVIKVVRQPDTDLPLSVLPQPLPSSYLPDKAIAQENKSFSASSSNSHAAVKKEVKVEAEETPQNTSVVPVAAQSSPQGATMTSSASLQKVLIKNDADLAAFVLERLGLDVEVKTKKLEEKKRLATIDKFTGKFAIQPCHRTYTKDMKLLMEMEQSVGAICATGGGKTVLYGTCFRVGPIYVLTCYHVVKKLEKELEKANKSSLLDIFITFNFEELPLESHNIRKCRLATVRDQVSGQVISPVVFASEELDFAMLKMDFSPDLPLPITEYGYELDTTGLQLTEDDGLTLIGHPGPGNEPKQIDTFCPIEHNDLAKENSLYIKHHGTTYHVTAFIHSSSGSPGVNVETKKVIAIHSRGIPLNSPNGGRYSIDQGTMISSVIKFVKQNCVAANMDINDFFGELPEPQTPFSLTPQFPEPMET